MKSEDLSKIRRYCSDLGFDYWIDPEGNAIQTSQAGVRMTFHECRGMGYIGHSYAKLHVGDDCVIVTSKKSNPKRISFSPDFGEKTPDRALIWHVEYGSDLIEKFVQEI